MLLVLPFLLAACGGGSSNSSPPAPPPPVDPVSVSSVPVNDPGSVVPGSFQNGPFMEIYVRGYFDSNGDGTGDLAGVTAKLDYLQGLGIKGIWLMPITDSEDHDHGYSVANYRGLEAAYGSMSDFSTLITQAHARGIAVILDYVMNHSADTHPIFANSASSSSNPYRNWYIWSPTHPSGWNIYGNDPWYYRNGNYYFAGFYYQMPDWNLLNPEVVAFHHSNLHYWLNLGADGFRFDAVGNFVENGPSAWSAQPQDYTLAAAIRSDLNAYQNRFMVCEAPADPFGFANACGSAFAFGHNYDLMSAAVNGDSGSIANVASFPNTAPATISTLLANHDSFAGARIYDQVNGNLAEYRLAAATYLTQPGVPFIYYGEEIGMSGAHTLSGDHSLRSPMSWTSNGSTAGFTTGTPFRDLSSNVSTFNVAAEINDPNSLYTFYKTLIGLRNSHPALNSGSYLNASANGSTLSFSRSSGSDHVLMLFNYGTSTASLTAANLPANATLTPLYPSAGSTLSADGNGNLTSSLAAQSFQMLQY